MKNRTTVNFQEVDRDEPTIASVGAAYSDDTRNFFKKES